ncbi:MAG: hypothetical protein EBR19_02830 [Chitinophagaceae bacterium]|nr:hypothetical protein [Chitinophagaceae bacterium]
MSLSVLLACQSSSDNSGEHHDHSAMEAPKTPADSLYGQVMEMHDLVMPKMGKVRGAQLFFLYCRNGKPASTFY